MGMKRSRSGLIQPEPEPIEHGCQPHEVAARRLAAQEAHRKRKDEAYTVCPTPSFADWQITDRLDLWQLENEMGRELEKGARYRLRIVEVV